MNELKKEAEDDVIPLEITGSVKVYNQAYVDKQEKRVAELEKAVHMFSTDGLQFLNSIKSNRNCIDCESKMNVQLIKAKEVLHLFLELKTAPCASGNSINMLHFENACKKAEQFLKDSEVEK